MSQENSHLIPQLRFKDFIGDWTSSILRAETEYVDYRGKTPRKTTDGVDVLQ